MSFQTRKTFLLFRVRPESTMTHVHGAAADVEHSCAAPCLQAEKCTRIHRGEEKKLLNKVIIFVSLRTKTSFIA